MRLFRCLSIAASALAVFGTVRGADEIVVPAAIPEVSLPPVPRRAEFWRGIVAAKFAVPPAIADSPVSDADSLAWELTSYLATPDPEWRDGFGFEITSAWLRRNQISPAMRQRLGARWREGLRRSGGDDAAVLERAFSALNLSMLVATDLPRTEPLLSASETVALLEEALAAFSAERDRRGYDTKLGWVHCVAHEADLLRFLAQSPHVGTPELGRILDALGTQLAASDRPWAWREDERVGFLLLTVARRPECSTETSAQFVRRLTKLPHGYDGVLVNEPEFHVRTNVDRMLTAVLQTLSASAKPRDAELAAAWRAAIKG